MARDNLIENGQRIVSLSQAVAGGLGNLKYIPGFVEDVCNNERWRAYRVPQSGQDVAFDSFSDFVTSKPPEGLGTTVKELERLCSDNNAALDAIGRALEGEAIGDKGGRPSSEKTLYNIQGYSAPTGTTSTAAIRRLRKDRPDLLDSVLEGELSPHAAMVEAGFRPRKFQVYAEDVERTARLLVKHMTPDAIEELQVWLDKLA